MFRLLQSHLHAYTFCCFIMKRISSIAHLSVFICVFVADLITFFLRWQLIRLNSKTKLFCQPQTWIMILKCALNFALINLLTLNISKKIDDDKQKFVRILCILYYSDWLIRLEKMFELAVKLFFRFFITCVSISEICFLSEKYISANAHVSS